MSIEGFTPDLSGPVSIEGFTPDLSGLSVLCVSKASHNGRVYDALGRINIAWLYALCITW